MQLAPLQPLQHRRDVPACASRFKILKQGAPHLVYPGSLGDTSPILHPGRQQKGPTTHCSFGPDSDFFRSSCRDTAGCGTM
ncbi:hypothetical protein GWK47_022896 [Chionoecetes opilio]|uniref:Uncharacterized protein n=1 Tax=Chionoecetes opilio TaxID=41210 RepID=A0A8J4XQ43_CHIOP|nr:hypothetical protein GWK47_022896 [Chionoecetes opilio]